MTNASAHYQLFPALDPATESALRASIVRFGVLVPATVDQSGNILDGHHRSRIARELGVDCPTIVRQVNGDDEANEIARTLNMDRRHLSAEDRRRMVEALRSEGHSYRAIAGALGVSKDTIARDADRIVSPETMPDRIRTSDGRTYPARRPEPIDRPAVVADVALTLAAAEPDRDDADLEDEAEAIAGTLTEPTQPAINAACAANIESRRTPEPFLVPKKYAGEGIPPHPATYPQAVMAIFRDIIPTGSRVLDPFGGVGTIHELRPDVETHAIEIEAEWAAASPHTTHGDSTRAGDLFPVGHFDAIATSPAYGNRLADAFYNAADAQSRNSYALDLGRALDDGNGAGMHFAKDGRYEDLHRAVWAAVVPLLRPGGLFVLNCKDFQRDGKLMRPTGWNLEVLTGLGLRVVDLHTLPAKGLPFASAAPMSELVVVLRKAQ